jgi:hypothetical protein
MAIRHAIAACLSASCRRRRGRTAAARYHLSPSPPVANSPLGGRARCRYRPRRVREHSGYNPRTFDGLVELICLLDVLDQEVPASSGSVRPRGDS